jgi:hypothetical protein
MKSGFNVIFLINLTLLFKNQISINSTSIKREYLSNSEEKYIEKKGLQMLDFNNTYLSVVADEYDFKNNQYQKADFKRKINTKPEFSQIFKISKLNRQSMSCNNKQCKFCCLNHFFLCGNEFQCMKVNDITNYNKILSYLLIFLITVLTIYKISSSQGHPPNDENDKLDDKTLNIYYNLFIHNEINRRRFKL